MLSKSVSIKAQLLANGIRIDDSLIKNFKGEFVEKRRAFGNQDPKEFLKCTIPQEIYISPENVICAVNVKNNSKWSLIYECGKYCVTDGVEKVLVSFPKRPDFYNKKLKSNPEINVNQIITLYGGNCLGVFANRYCSFGPDNLCHFCSLKCNHGKENDFLDIIKPEIMEEALEIALENADDIRQIAITGGIYGSLDNSFDYFYNLAQSALKVLKKVNREDIRILLVISPPTNRKLLDRFKGMNIKVSMDIEVFRKDLFEKFCPGKNKHVGYQNFIDSLIYLTNVIGKGNVYSILVGGLEPIASFEEGADFFAKHGIVPVVNVLHVDPGTKMKESDKPSAEYILKLGKILQRIYSKHGFEPFYNHCGRNSLDTEAYEKMLGE